MLITKDILLYILEFLTISDFDAYSKVSNEWNNIFRQSIYYPEYVAYNECKEHTLINVSKFGNILLLKKAFSEFKYTFEDLFYSLTIKC